jgi:hypothetical protein
VVAVGLGKRTRVKAGELTGEDPERGTRQKSEPP